MTASVLDVSRGAAAPPSFGPGAPGFAQFQLGARTLQDAARLAESPAGAASALLLLRAAVLSLLAAQLARQRGNGAEPSSGELAQDIWTSLQRQPSVGLLLQQLPAEHSALLQQLLARGWDETALSRLDAVEQAQCLLMLRRLAFALGDPLQQQASAARRLHTARRLRSIVAASVLLLALVMLLVAAFSQPNLALNKPVLVEATDPELAISPARLVDGDRSNLGLATLPGGTHSVRIDLQTPQRIRSVHVYNRMDCCLERAVPLAVEVSADGKTFQRVAGRARRFALWKAKFPAVEARWVRLVHLNPEPFHLAEIEVY